MALFLFNSLQQLGNRSSAPDALVTRLLYFSMHDVASESVLLCIKHRLTAIMYSASGGNVRVKMVVFFNALYEDLLPVSAQGSEDW